MLNQFTYRFTPYRPGVDPARKATANQVRVINDEAIDRLKNDFGLNEASDIGDLRDAVRKLTE